MNSDLTPVAITDKNGKRTTVHRKTQTDKGSTKAPLPPPWASGAYKQKLEDRQALRNKIFALAVNDATSGPNGAKPLERTLAVINNSEFLQQALEVAEAIRDSKQEEFARMGEWRNFAEDLSRRTPIEVAHHNIDLVRESNKIGNGYSRIRDIHQSIIEGAPRDTSSPVFVENMQSHLIAYNLLRAGTSPHTDDIGQWGVYGSKYAPIVSDYPDHVEQVCAYLEERGGAQAFDKQAFEEYLDNATPLAEGTL